MHVGRMTFFSIFDVFRTNRFFTGSKTLLVLSLFLHESFFFFAFLRFRFLFSYNSIFLDLHDQSNIKVDKLDFFGKNHRISIIFRKYSEIFWANSPCRPRESLCAKHQFMPRDSSWSDSPCRPRELCRSNRPHALNGTFSATTAHTDRRRFAESKQSED